MVNSSHYFLRHDLKFDSFGIIRWSLLDLARYHFKIINVFAFGLSVLALHLLEFLIPHLDP